MSKRNPLPANDDVAPAIARLRELAAQAARNGTAERPASHPDAALLELCAKVLDLRAESDAIWREAHKMPVPFRGDPAFKAEMKRRDKAANACRSPMMRIGKIAAKTAAGVYAKALVLRTSYGMAPRLALSIVEDLIECPGLRRSLWPAGEA